MKKKFTLLLLIYFSHTLAFSQQVYIDPPGPFDTNQLSPTLQALPSGATNYSWYMRESLSPCLQSSLFIGTGQTWVPTGGIFYCVATWPNGTTSTSQDVTVRDIGPVPYMKPTFSGSFNFCSSGGGTKILYAPPATYNNCWPNWWDSYQWKRNNVNIPGANFQTYAASLTGYYKVTITSTIGVATTDSVYIRADSPASPTVSAAGSTTFCSGGSVVLNETAAIAYSHQWQKNNVNIPAANGVSYTATTSGTYRCVITNVCGTYTSNSITVTTTAVPVGSISANGNTAFCTGASVLLSAVPGSAGTTYQWKKNGNVISSANSTTYNAVTSGSYTIAVTNNGCTSNSNVIVVSVYTAVPSKPGTISHINGNKVCPGDVRIYSINPVLNTVSYSWQPPAGSNVISGQGTTSITVSYTSSFQNNDSLRVAAVNSCGTGLVKALSVKRNNPTTPGSIVGNKYGVCNTNQSYSVPVMAGMNYAWIFTNAGASVSSGQGTNAVTAAFTGAFVSANLQVTASNSCGVSAARVASVYGKPGIPGNITGATSVCAFQQNVAYSIAPVYSVLNYKWIGPTGSQISDGINTSVGNTLITTSTGVTVDYGSADGVLKVKGSNGCGTGGSKTAAINIVCRIASENVSMEVDVYPNPSNGTFFISHPLESVQSSEVRIINVVGLRVNAEVKIENENLIRITGIPQGVYFVRIRGKMVRVINN